MIPSWWGRCVGVGRRLQRGPVGLNLKTNLFDFISPLKSPLPHDWIYFPVLYFRVIILVTLQTLLYVFISLYKIMLQELCSNTRKLFWAILSCLKRWLRSSSFCRTSLMGWALTSLSLKVLVSHNVLADDIPPRYQNQTKMCCKPVKRNKPPNRYTRGGTKTQIMII